MPTTIQISAQPKAQPSFLAVVLYLYALALKLYPSAFRLAFADEMLNVFEMSLRDTSGRFALLKVVWRELYDLLSISSAHAYPISHLLIPSIFGAHVRSLVGAV
ncbi:MAG: hypothetical protein GC179_21700 [Anaerolineaceae bacterium]|nr:hypothetical protein [Anaerolineaceae bacterium]